VLPTIGAGRPSARAVAPRAAVAGSTAGVPPGGGRWLAKVAGPGEGQGAGCPWSSGAGKTGGPNAFYSSSSLSELPSSWTGRIGRLPVRLDELQQKLKAFADTVNLFKSEAAQLRVLDALLGYLSAPDEVTLASGPRATSRKRKRKSQYSAEASPKSQVRASRKSSRSSGTPGASAAITKLLETGFFKTPKTIGMIVQHCGSARGHHYKANECSPALLRLVREEKLTREKNTDGQYEYTQA